MCDGVLSGHFPVIWHEYLLLFCQKRSQEKCDAHVIHERIPQNGEWWSVVHSLTRDFVLLEPGFVYRHVTIGFVRGSLRFFQ